MIDDRILYVDNYHLVDSILRVLIVGCVIEKDEVETTFHYFCGRHHMFTVTKPLYKKDGKIYICGREGYHELFPCTLEYLKENTDLIKCTDVREAIFDRCHTTDDLWEFARRSVYFTGE